MGDHYGSELPAHAPFSYNKYQTIHGVDSFIAPRDLRRMGKGRQPRKRAKNTCRTRLFSRSCWTWRVFGHFHKQNGAFAKWGRRVHPFHGFETVRWSGSHVPWRAAVWRRGILFPEVAGAAEVSRRPRHEPPVCRRKRCASRPVRGGGRNQVTSTFVRRSAARRWAARATTFASGAGREGNPPVI